MYWQADWTVPSYGSQRSTSPFRLQRYPLNSVTPAAWLPFSDLKRKDNLYIHSSSSHAMIPIRHAQTQKKGFKLQPRLVNSFPLINNKTGRLFTPKKQETASWTKTTSGQWHCLLSTPETSEGRCCSSHKLLATFLFSEGFIHHEAGGREPNNSDLLAETWWWVQMCDTAVE